MNPQRTAETFANRADRLILWLAETYAPPGSGGKVTIPQATKGVPDPQKYVWPKAIARLKRDPNDAWARASVAQFWDKGGEPAPHAASFYHFAAYGLARLLFAFPEAVAPHREGILREAMREEQLFSADGTENHIAMWRTSGYLFAQAAGDTKNLSRMREWALTYADRLYRNGQGEWDSSTYASFDIASWLNLYDYAADAEIRQTAKRVVDFFAAAMALKYVHGVFAGAEKRGFSSRSTETIASFTAWLWFDDTPKPADEKFFSQSAIYTVTPALSGYRPSPETLALADKRTWKGPETYRIRRPNYAMARPGEAVEILYLTPRYGVGSSVRSPIGGWGGGDGQETLWKMAARGDDAAATAFVLSGAGASYAVRNKWLGEGRGPWDQVTQHGRVVFQMTRVPANADDLTAQAKALFAQWKQQGNAAKVSFIEPVAASWAYLNVPASADTEEVAGILFLRMGEVYAAARPLHGAYRWASADETKVAAVERRIAITEAARGDLAGWVIEFGDRDADGSFEDFTRALQQPDRLTVDGLTVTYRNRAGETLTARFVPNGTYTEPEYDWGPQPTWPTGEGHGRVPTLAVNGKPVEYAAPGPLYEGPRRILVEPLPPASGKES